jgi:hypothetical protein
MPSYNGHRLDHFFTSLGEGVVEHPRYRMGEFRKSFSLRNMSDAPDPDELFKRILAYFIDAADWNSGYMPTMFSCIIRSEHLTPNIQVPYRTFEQNTPDAILNLFNKVKQSNDKLSLVGSPLQIDIVTGSEDGGGGGGGASGAGGPPRTIEHNINKGSLIEV